jgi:hypothetical protein
MLIHHYTQLIIEETENLLEKWKHPDPYRAPTAPGGSKWERNLPVPSTERKFPDNPVSPKASSSKRKPITDMLAQRRHTCICKLEQRLMKMWRFYCGNPGMYKLLASRFK